MSDVTLDEEVREQVYATLSGVQTTDDLESWMAANTWDERTALVAVVDHALAERQVLDEAALQDQLRRAVSTIALHQREERQPIAAGATVTTTIRRGFDWRRNRTFTGQLAGS